MRRALSRVIEKQKTTQKGYKGSTFKDSSAIETTDYYVKFWVENDEQKSLLLADSLNLSIIPLDVEIVQEGDYYIDEDSELNEAQWLYAAVTKEYQFPEGINYETIEDLFLIEESGPEEEEGDEEENESTTTTVAGKKGISKEFLYDLEDESLRLTGNFENVEDENGLVSKKSKRIPKGYIKVRNTVTGNYDPVVEVKVKTRRWFKWAQGWTNSQGYYKVNRGYRRDVHYTVVFKNTRGFKIWPSVVSVSAARYRAGKHSKFGHSVNFNTNSAGWRWATVNNATVKYWNYCSQFGIGRPHSNLRIVALGGSGSSSAPMLRRIWGVYGFTSNSKVSTFLAKANGLNLALNGVAHMLKFIQPDLIIKANASKGTDGVFSVVFHELAHASHFRKVGSGYWIKYINYIITYGAYGNGHGKNSQICGIGEMWGNYIGWLCLDREFSSENFSFDRNENWFNPGFLEDVDDIPDVTTAEIYSCLNSSTDTFMDLNAKLKTKTTNDEQVDILFNNYTDWP